MDEFLEQVNMIKEISRSIVERGWAEESTGNLSTLLVHPIDLPNERGILFETGLFLPQLEGRSILITRAGSRFADIRRDPEENLGLYLFGYGGRYAELIWGSGAPSTEWMTHLLLYAHKGKRINAILHCHIHEASILDRMIESDPSGIPEWITWIDEIGFGTLELGEITLQEIGNNDIVFWKGHGILSVSSDIEGALKNMITFDEWTSSLVVE